MLYLVLSLLLLLQVKQPDWVIISKSSDGTSFEYDKNNIKKKNSYFLIWEKKLPVQDSLPFIRKSLYNENNQNTKYLHYSYSVSRLAYDCTEGQCQILENIDYDIYENVINSKSANLESTRWRSIVPGSVGAEMLNILCTHDDRLWNPLN